MSLWPAKPHGLHIGGRDIVLDRAGGRHKLDAAAGDWAALAAELGPLVPRGARLAVRVADCWTRYWLLEPPAGVSSLRDCRLLLGARFEALYGQSPDQWLLRADWQAGAPMFACALPRALRAALDGCALARLEPALLAQWNRHAASLEAEGLWCARADGMLNLLYWQDGALRLVRQQRGDDIDQLLALELARLGCAMPAARYWSGASAPPGWRQLEKAA